MFWRQQADEMKKKLIRIVKTGKRMWEERTCGKGGTFDAHIRVCLYEAIA